MTALLIVVVLAVAAMALLAVMAVALLRHLSILSGSLKEFNDAVTPLLEQIRAESETAQRRVQALEERRAGRMGSGRIRR